MNCFVSRDGKQAPVKNLGWLLRHWRDISYVRMDYKPEKLPCDAVLCANFKDKSGFYMAQWADASIMYRWLNRPVFRGLPANIGHNRYGTSYWTEIGCNNWNRAQALPYPFFLNE